MASEKEYANDLREELTNNTTEIATMEKEHKLIVFKLDSEKMENNKKLKEMKISYDRNQDILSVSVPLALILIYKIFTYVSSIFM